MWRTTQIIGSFEGDVGAVPDAPRAYGDLEPSTVDFSADRMYWFCNATAVPPDGLECNEETAEAVHGVVDTAVRLLSTWEGIVTGPIDPQDARSLQFRLQCDAVVRDVDGWEPRAAALSGAGDAHEFEYDAEVITLVSAMQRVFAMRTAAHRYLCRDADAGENALEPFRAALSNDKLAIFEDHPAPDYRYYTIAKHVIETPQQLAEATVWFFEGVDDVQVRGTVDGRDVAASVSGWRLLGYQFDDDQRLVDEFEYRGGGSSAPKSAFVGR